MHMFHVKHPQTLRISYNKYMQYDFLFIQYDKTPRILLPEVLLCFSKKNPVTIFPDLVHQPDFISAVLFVRKME